MHGCCPYGSRSTKTLLVSVSLMMLAALKQGSLRAESQTDFFDLTLEELMQVKVTAQKREQNAQDVPLSVATLGGETLDVLNSSGMDVRQLSIRVPSLLVESSFGRTFPRFYLRGMGNTDFDLISSQPVSLILDEVVLENSLLKGFPMFDLDRVEVLRGPQGTLFGRNTPAGIIKFESRKPSAEYQSYGNFGYGSFGSANLEAAVNTPLSDTMATRFSVLSQTRNNWIDNAAPGYEQKNQLGGYDNKAGRFQWRYQDNEHVDLLLNYHFQKEAANARIFMANIIEPGSNDFVHGFDPETVYQDAGAHNEQTIDMNGASIRMQYNFGSHSVFYVGGYETAEIFSRGDIDGGYGSCKLVQLPPGQNNCDRHSYADPYQRGAGMGPGFLPFSSETGVKMPEHQQITHELRLASNNRGALDYQFGLFWFDEDLTIDNLSYDSLQGGRQNGLSEQRMVTDSWAAFGSLDYDWTEKLSTVTGLRYSHDQRDWSGELIQSPIGGQPFQSQATVNDQQWSWDISSMYALSKDIKYYGRVAKGYRAPSIQGRNLLFSALPTTADSETLLSYELGLKSEFMQNRARVNASLFRYTVKGQQLTAVGGNDNVAKLLNAHKTLGYGFELDSEFAIASKFLVSAGLSYNHTELDDPNLAVPVCSSGCTVLDPTIPNPNNPAQRLALIDGNPLPQSPKWIADITARYAWSVNRGEIFVYTDWAYRSKITFHLYESKEYSDDYLLEGGLRIGYDWLSEKNQFECALLGRNITNETSLESGLDFNNMTGYLNEPRYWGIEFKARFY